MNRTITQLVILARTFADELEALLQGTQAQPETPAPAKRGRGPAKEKPPQDDPKKEEPAKEEPAAEGMSLEALKALIKPVVDAAAGLQVKELIKKHGGSQLADLPPANHAAFAEDVGALVY